jgi:hypothetical protein
MAAAALKKCLFCDEYTKSKFDRHRLTQACLFRCPTCETEFERLTALKKHYIEKHVAKEEKFICNWCCKTFIDEKKFFYGKHVNNCMRKI